jgi:hypothetical protein
VGVLIVIILICALGYGVAAGIKRRKQQEAEDETFMGKHRGWDIYVSPHDRGVLALNHDTRQIVVGEITKNVECSWSDLNAVEIEKNGQSVQQTNRGSQVMGAAVGAALLGPLGLLVGGLTGSKRSRERINELSLKVTVDHREAPIHRIIFFRMEGSGVDAKDNSLRAPAAKMEHWHALLSNAVRADRRNTFAPQARIAFSNSKEPEARIAALWSLHQSGALTADEFQSQKLAVLSTNEPRAIS